MKLSTIVLPIVGLAVSANAGGKDVYTTKVVTAYTTYCPSPTTWAYGNKTYTVTKPTTITITNCPCTLSVTTPPVYTTTIPCNTTSKPWGNSTYYPPVTTTVITPPPTTYLPVTTPPTSRTPIAPTTKASTSPAVVTPNAAAHVGSGAGVIALLGAAAVYLL